MKYLLYTVLLFVFTSVGLLAQIATKDLSNLAPIRIKAEQIRVPFELSAMHDLFLSDLTIGKKYELYIILPGLGPYTFDVIEKKTGNSTSAYPFTLTATTREQNFILQLPLPANKSTYGYITLQTTGEEAPFSMPGLPRNPPPIVTNSSVSLQSLVEDYFIKSSCVAVSNISFSGGSNQRGTFANGNTSVGYSTGLMLATGGISVATGPNNATGAVVPPTGPSPGNDPDLAILLPGAQYHKAILEFDFIPENDTVSFEYVFASEEYCDFTNTSFNDVFGFFLSGPGLSGPFSNNGINIAVIPSTMTPVSINNVNHIDNSAYYHGNIQAGNGQLSNGNCAGHPGLPPGTPSVADCQFDGLTVPMQAYAVVVPCETYHIKLAIADIADGNYDSGVFFKLNSFNAGDGSQAEVVYDANNPAAATEGCSNVYYIFTKPLSSAGLPYTINLTHNSSSTATAGLDYTPFPLTWLIPAGKDTIHVHVNVLADLITEGNETIVLNLLNGCFCTPPQITLNIQDRPVLVVQLEGDTVCAGQNITLMPTVSGGIPPYTYLWSNSAVTESIVVSLTGLSSFSVTVYDNCNQAKADTALYYISPPISAAITGDTTICSLPLGSATMHVTFTGPGPWQFVILKDGVPFNTFTTNTNPFTFPVNQIGTYTLGSVVNTGTLCDGATSGAGTVAFATIDLSITAEPFACLANQGSIDLSVGGGFPGYTYLWSGGLGGTQDIPNVGGGNYTVTVTDTKGCSNSASITVPTLPALMVSPGLVTPQNCNGGGSVTVNVNGGTPNYEFNWNNGPGGPTQNPVPGGTYSVTITDANGCTNSTAMVVPVDTIHPAANAGQGGLINCFNPTLQLNGNGSAVGATITYQWQAYNGGNIVSGSNTLLPIVNAGGIYELIVTNNTNGCTRTDTVQVQEDKVPPTADILPPLTLTCAVDTITLDGSGSSVGPNFTYVWTTIGGLIVSGQGTSKIKVTKPGNYTLSVRNTVNGCVTPISIDVIQDIAKPDANAGPVKMITCDDVTVILTGGNSSGPEFDYSWTTLNGNIIAGEFSPTPEVDEPGLYTLYILNTTNGCKDTATVTVLINQVYPLAVGGPDTIINCYKPSTKLNGSGSNSGAGYTITWTTLDGNIVSGGNTLMPTINAEGTYVISVRNNVNGCITEDEVLVLDVRDYPVIIIDPPFDLNCAATEELLNASSGSFGPEFTYIWTTSGGNIVSGADTPYPIVNDDGTYTFKVTNIINGCFTVQSVEVYENFVTPEIVISPVDSITCLQPNVMINASGSSQGSIYQISWTTANGSIIGGQGTLNPTVNAAGTYVLTMTHSNSLCVDIDSITVVADANIPVSNAGIPDTLNCNVSLIQLQGTVSGGNNLAYGWTYTPGGNIESDSTTLTPTVNAPGTYILTVTNLANSCVNSSSVIIALDTITPSIVIQPVPILNCQTTSVNLDASGSTSNLFMQYSWATLNGNLPGNTSVPITQTGTPGIYTLSVVNQQNHCQGLGSIEVFQDTAKPFAILLATDTLTCAQPVLNLVGNQSTTGPQIKYSWTSTNGNIISPPTGQNIDVDLTGNYQLIVLDTVNHCSDTASIFVPVDKLTPIANAGNLDSLTCSVSSLNLKGTISGTIHPIQIKWNTSNGNIASGGNTLTPVIDAPGDYWLVLVDPQNGCTDSSMVIITKNANIPVSDIQFNGVLTCDVTTVLLDGNGSTKTPGITHTWSSIDGQYGGGTNGLTPTVTAAGTYTLTVYDPSNNCTATKTITVLSDTISPKLQIIGDILTCKNPSIKLLGILSSDTLLANYTFNWSTIGGNIQSGGNTLNPTVNQTGLYTLSSSNKINGCDNAISIQITENKTLPLVEAGNVDTLNCAISSLSLSGNGSSVGNNFTYQWSTLNGNIIGGGLSLNPTIDAPGTYQILVTDTVNGCINIDQVNVVQDIVQPIASAGNPILLTCKNPVLPLNASGSSGSPNLTFDWSTGNGNIVSGPGTPNPQVDAIGDYVVVVTNPQNHCKDTAQVIVTEDKLAPDAFVDLADTITCTQKLINLQGSTGYVGPSIYSWTTINGNIQTGGNTLSPVVNAVGIYVLHIENTVNGCIGDFAIEVVQDASVPIALAGAPDTLTCLITQIQLSGQGSSNGADFSYQWSTQNGNIVSGDMGLSPVINAPGTYQLTVINSLSQCDNASFVQIVQDIQKPTADAGLPVLISCSGNSALLDGSGSSQGNLFKYQWTSLDGGSISNPNAVNPTVGAEGNYQLIVVNQFNGCRDTSTVEVLRDLPLAEIEVRSPICEGYFGNIQVLGIQGGTPPYEFSFNQEAFGSAQSFNNLDPGTYEVVVRDALGCVYNQTLEVESPEAFKIALTGFDTIQLGEYYQLQASIEVPLDQIDTIIWNPTAGLSCTNCLDPIVSPYVSTTYTLKLITSQGCESEGTFRLLVKRPQIFVPNMFSPNGDGQNDLVTVFANPLGIKRIKQFMIFDRWGAQIFVNNNFDPNDISTGWDGKFRGKTLNPAVFVWWAEAETIDGKTIFEKGDITLIR